MDNMSARPAAPTQGEAEPWQLRMFRRTLKKQQKLKVLLDMIGALEDEQRCLLVTCGDNNGALNWHFKSHGGRWFWADAEEESVRQIGALTGDPVAVMNKDRPALPFPDDHFDVVVTIDVHEHLHSVGEFNAELARTLKPGGRAIVTTPNGDETKLAVRIKNLVGMGPEVYGHIVVGYDVPELEAQMRAAGLSPYAQDSYARFFTEMLELLINFAYVKLLSKGSKAEVKAGQIAPQSEKQLESVEKTYRLYSLIYPFFWAFSKLDGLIGFTRGYAVVVAARKA